MSLRPQNVNSKADDFIPTGIQTLDTILGGGFPVGSVVLLNEDELGSYADIFLQIFLAQGVHSGDKLFIASNDTNTQSFVKHLPQASVDRFPENNILDEPMKIAFRYEESYVPRVDLYKGKSLSCNFNFKTKVPEATLSNVGITHWPENDTSYSNLESSIQTTLTSNNLMLNQKSEFKNVLRIALHKIGSSFWENEHELPNFLFKFRRLCHSSRSVGFITMPSEIIKADIMARCELLSDIQIELNSIDGSTNPLYSEYDGTIKFIQVNPVRSICSNMTESTDWAFKFIKKQLLIERLTIPPELADSTQREQDSSCSMFQRPSLQF